MSKAKIPAEFRAYLAKIGSKGGKIGGAKRAANMTPEERSESARKAVQARWAAEKAKQTKNDV
jgi:hypothetical protein